MIVFSRGVYCTGCDFFEEAGDDLIDDLIDDPCQACGCPQGLHHHAEVVGT